MKIKAVNGKRTFDMASIMHEAWAIFHVEKKTFSEALKAAWAKAKSVMASLESEEKHEMSQEEKLEQYKDKVRSAEGDEDKIEEILDKGMDDLDIAFFGELQNFAFKMF